jgi:hypothetical protein
MPVSFTDKPVTICTCLYGDFPALARRVLGSIVTQCDRSQYYLRVGCNTVSDETMKFVLSLGDEIDDLYISNHNLNKDPMHKRMLCDMETKYHLWLDDDSAIESEETLGWYIDTAEASDDDVALWGHLVYVDSMFDHVEQYDEEGRRDEMVEQVYEWIRSQKWYKGGQIPSGILRLGDTPEDYIRHELIHGSAYMARTHVLKDVLDWPSPGMSKVLGDVLLSEAVKQAGYSIQNTAGHGITMQSFARRGDGEDYAAFKHLFG